jgi:hypothetical protein
MRSIEAYKDEFKLKRQLKLCSASTPRVATNINRKLAEYGKQNRRKP